MVLAHCLIALAPQLRLSIHAVHVDYGARSASRQEANFVQAWASEAGVPLNLVQLHGTYGPDTRRCDFERLSRQARYAAYQQTVDETAAPAVLTGHHRDDAAENVLDNLVMGRSIFRVPVMAPDALIEGVNVWRPLAGISKQEIRSFARRQEVPHLKDNDTPGTKRSVMRSQVIPALSREFGDRTLENIVRVGAGAEAWKGIIDKFVLGPFWKNVQCYPHGAVVPFGLHAASPGTFWEEALLGVLHGLGTPMLTKRAVDKLVDVLHSGRSALIALHKVFHIYVDQPGERLILINSKLLPVGAEQDTAEEESNIRGWSLTWSCRRPESVSSSLHRSGLAALLSGSLERHSSRGLLVGSGPDAIPEALAVRLPGGNLRPGDIDVECTEEDGFVLQMEAE
ncbi:unnamed protein product, partial [Polarella glacialis]